MRKTSKGLLAVALVVLGTMSMAQEKNDFPDTLRINADGIDLTVAMYKIKERPKLSDELWRSILGAIESSVSASSDREGVRATYSNEMVGEEKKAKITIEPLDKQSDIFWIGSEGMEHQSSGRIEFVVELEEVALSFSINEMDKLESVKEISVEGIWNELEANHDKMKNNRLLYSGKGTINYGVLRLTEINKSDPKDFIELGTGVGMGFYRNRFVPNVGFDISFNFSDRYGNLKRKFGLLYTSHYFLTEESEGDFKLDLNGFLSVYATVSLGNDRQYGIGLGYLVNQSGDFYKGDTFIMSIYNRSRTSRTSITPELIFTDGFKQAFPALRFGLTF